MVQQHELSRIESEPLPVVRDARLVFNAAASCPTRELH